MIAQTVLVVPIVAALARQVAEDAWDEYARATALAGRRRGARRPTLLWDTRFSLLTVVLAGFGRAARGSGRGDDRGRQHRRRDARDDHRHRAGDLKGDLPLALGLGIVLIAIVLAVNAGAYAVRRSARRHG